MRSYITLAILAMLSFPANAEEQGKRHQWFEMNGIGFHHHGNPEMTILNDVDIKRYFTHKMPFISEVFQKEVLDGLIAKTTETKLNPEQHRPSRDQRCFAEVSKFNKEEVYIKILKPLGGWRWHHHFDCLAVYRTKRNQTVDDIFGTDKLYEKFSFTYKGIGHGMPGPDIRAKDNKVIEILGKPDYVYPSQSPSLGRYYYRKHDLYIVTHHFLIYYLEKGKPGWVKYLEKDEDSNKPDAGDGK